ncbi:influenza virus NS1A-binding protein homolog isoform X1 [Haliotis asinina]|uniref:influenza virus NS1A-binding protein homolog isoform X1 n=2 Tax=Haliotis asinina TaxID=109174 RepID=UPI003531A9D9
MTAGTRGTLRSMYVNGLKQTETGDLKMSAISNGYPGDEDQDGMVFANPSHSDDVLMSIQTLRKSQKFCDVKLVVDNHEIFAHRAVLAASSATLFDLFSKGDDSIQTSSMVKLKDIKFSGFSYLLDYMYTGRLTVPAEDVREVYAMARRLKIMSAVDACADYLSSTLTPVNCLDVRMYAEDDHFRNRINSYIQDNIGAVTSNKRFFGLPRIQLEIIGTDESFFTYSNEKQLFDLALDWVKASVDEVKPKFDRLIEKVNVLYLCADNVLRDCKDIDDENFRQDMTVQDYKKLMRKQSGIDESRIPSSSNGKQQHPFHKFNIEPEMPKNNREWSVVAGHMTKEHTYLCMVMLGNEMATLSIHFRMPQSSPYSSSSEGPDSPIHNKSRTNSFERLCCPHATLATMSTPRCAFGIRAVKGKIVACGGYDRGEVMKSAEVYDPETNAWRKLPPMRQARGRFTAAHLDGKLYAIGGSDGHNELSAVECLDPETEMWSNVASVHEARASPGVAVLKGKIYCVGGSYGQKSLRNCEVYDPETNTWSRIASLNSGRFQTCVRAFENRLYAVGGTDGWNVFNTVEVYNPDKDVWEYGPSLNVARRGAGIEAFNGKLYIVGGSDGTQSLKTTEAFDPKEQQWTFNPALNTPRANVGAAIIDNRLFAVGGFSGKHFLDNMEYFDEEHHEWSMFEPFSQSRSRSMSNASDSSGNSLCNGNNGTNCAVEDSNGTNGAPKDLKGQPCGPASVNGH